MKQRAIFSLKNFPSSARTITVCELEGQGNLREKTTNAVVIHCRLTLPCDIG